MPAKMQRAFRSEEIEAFERNVPLVKPYQKIGGGTSKRNVEEFVGIRAISKRMEGGARREKRIDSVSIRKVCLSVDGETLFLLVNTSAG